MVFLDQFLNSTYKYYHFSVHNTTISWFHPMQDSKFLSWNYVQIATISCRAGWLWWNFLGGISSLLHIHHWCLLPALCISCPICKSYPGYAHVLELLNPSFELKISHSFISSQMKCSPLNFWTQVLMALRIAIQLINWKNIFYLILIQNKQLCQFMPNITAFELLIQSLP